MSDERKVPGKVDAKTRRDKRLAEALRANLRRRKTPETAEKKPANRVPDATPTDGKG